MNNKTIIGIIVAAIAAYFLFFRKKKEETQVVNEEAVAIDHVKREIAANTQEAVQVVEMDADQEKFNRAREEYRTLVGSYPKSTWTLKMIEEGIEEAKAKTEAIATYVRISGDADTEDEAEMTLSQINDLIEAEKKEKIDTVKTLINAIGTVTLNSKTAIQTARTYYDNLSEDLKKEITNFSTLTSAESTLKSLQQQKAAADAKAAQLAQQKASWDQKKAKVNTIVTAFKNTVENNGTALKQVAWDTNTLQAMLNLSQAEKVYANQYFGSTLKGATVRKNYGGTKYKATSIYLAIPDGNTTNWRAGNATAKQVRSVFKSISGSVNEYGEII